jgi:hypothetical protein
MPPIKGETADAKAKKLANQSVALARKAQLQRINHVLKVLPEAITDVHKHLTNLGYMQDAEGKTGLASSRASSASAEKTKALPAPPQLAIANGAAEDVEDIFGYLEDPGHVDKSPVETKEAAVIFKKVLAVSSRYSNLSVAELSAVISACEPIALSSANLKSVHKKGQRLITMSNLSEILELMTNESLQNRLPQQAKTVGDLVEPLKRLNVSCGRRARDLALPFDHLASGIYELVCMQGKVFVKNRFRLDQKLIEINPPTTCGLYVDMNFSEFRASIKMQNSAWNMPCVMLFSASASSTGGLKKISAASACSGGVGANHGEGSATATGTGKSSSVGAEFMRRGVESGWKPPPPGKRHRTKEPDERTAEFNK